MLNQIKLHPKQKSFVEYDGDEPFVWAGLRATGKTFAGCYWLAKKALEGKSVLVLTKHFQWTIQTLEKISPGIINKITVCGNFPLGARFDCAFIDEVDFERFESVKEVKIVRFVDADASSKTTD